MHFAALSKKAGSAAVVLGILCPLAWLVLGASGVALITGYTAMYLVYETVHRRLHTHAPKGPIGRWARRHHFFHHFHAPDRNHGVTTSLWDHVFRTYTHVEGVKVPERQAMSWLIDRSSGDVRPAFHSAYELRRARPRHTQKAA